MTVLLTWVYNSTSGSLGLAVLFHSFSNFADWVVPTSRIVQGDGRAYAVQVCLNLIVVLVFRPSEPKPASPSALDAIDGALLLRSTGPAMEC